MVNYSYLLKTDNCTKVSIDWTKFKHNHIHYHYKYDTSYSDCRTLYDYAFFLNAKKLYGYFDNLYMVIFDNIWECLIWPDNITQANIYFDYNHLNLIWRLTFYKNDKKWTINAAIFDYNLPVIDESDYINHMFKIINYDDNFV